MTSFAWGKEGLVTAHFDRSGIRNPRPGMGIDHFLNLRIEHPSLNHPVRLGNFDSDNGLFMNHELSAGTSHIGWSAAGRHLAIIGTFYDESGKASAIKLLDLNDGKTKGPWKLPSPRISKVELSPDAGRAAIILGDNPHVLEIWDTDNGNKISEFAGHRVTSRGINTDCSLAWSPDGSRLAVTFPRSSESRSNPNLGFLPIELETIVWDTNTWKEIRTFITQPNRPDSSSNYIPLALAWSKDGDSLAVSSPSVRVWQVSSGKEAFHHFLDAGHVDFLTWSSDGRRLIAQWSPSIGFGHGDLVTPREVHIWDTETGQKVLRLQGLPALARFNDNLTAVWYGDDSDIPDLWNRDQDGIMIWDVLPRVHEPMPGAEDLADLHGVVALSTGQPASNSVGLC